MAKELYEWSERIARVGDAWEHMVNPGRADDTGLHFTPKVSHTAPRVARPRVADVLLRLCTERGGRAHVRRADGRVPPSRRGGEQRRAARCPPG
eukprot:scaffold4369_cov336-Prasinococcus_capsulatus_cf.AAC.3